MEKEPEKTVVCFGAGRVAAPLVKYLLRDTTLRLYVASALAGEAKHLCEKIRSTFDHNIPSIRLEPLVLDVLEARGTLLELCRKADCVVALVPEPAQAKIAEVCVRCATPLVTASYASAGIKALDQAAKDAKIPILCEMGLDPGIDHMVAMKLINMLKAKQGKIVSFSSVCGGLPAPEAANNPIKYKFSWSPVGALRAAQRPAQYLEDNKVVTIPGEEILTHAKPSNLFPKYELEQLPNGYSLPYAEYYEIPDVKSIFRGTLRYQNFCKIMHRCAQIGLLDEALMVEENSAWCDVLALKVKESVIPDLDDATNGFLHWLGLDSPTSFIEKTQPIMHAFCDVLMQKLSLAPSERDLVLMHIAVEAELPDGTHETQEAFYEAFGDQHDTNMSKTVGVTAAIGVQLMLEGKIQTYGVIGPTGKEVYEPALERLAAEGIRVTMAHLSQE